MRIGDLINLLSAVREEQGGHLHVFTQSPDVPFMWTPSPIKINVRTHDSLNDSCHLFAGDEDGRFGGWEGKGDTYSVDVKGVIHKTPRIRQ